MSMYRRFTKARQAEFFEVLARTGNVVASARAVGVTQQHVYWMRTEKERFRKRWEEAMAIAVSTLELECRRRAVDGWDQAVYYEGAQIGAIRRYSDKLLVTLLKAHLPSKYASNPQPETQGGGQSLFERLVRARKRLERFRAERAEEEKRKRAEQEAGGGVGASSSKTGREY